MQKRFDPAAGTNDENVRYGLSPTDIGFRRNLDCPASAPLRQIVRIEEGRISGSS
jgi:hypothetical protein